ncbi:hypothetical protein EV426DRAFT_709260 [Tirmania nivea]|nr:hypothetical protein EV426DRAFT_709260 [Tirmania nivea]
MLPLERSQSLLNFAKGNAEDIKNYMKSALAMRIEYRAATSRARLCGAECHQTHFSINYALVASVFHLFWEELDTPIWRKEEGEEEEEEWDAVEAYFAYLYRPLAGQ